MPPNPVMVLITRRVPHGRVAEFERLMAGMQAAAATFPGHMGGVLFPLDPAEPGCYHTLFAFDSEAHLQAWTSSPERGAWLERIASVTHGAAAPRVLTGLETWFALPAARTKAPPPRWKMALVTWVAIFTLVLLSSHTITPALGRVVPVPISVLVVTGLITGAMTWLVMPTLVRLFAGWLYPATPESASNPVPLSEKQ